MISQPSDETTLGKIIFASIGFIAVAFLAAMAGYVLANPQVPYNPNFGNDLILIGAYILLIAPYYISRQGLLERKIENENKQWTSSVQSISFEAPLFAFFLVAVIDCLAVLLLFKPPNNSWFPAAIQILLAMVIGLFPFYSLLFISIRDLTTGNSTRAFRFVERVLFPAIATGVIPFAYGWSLSGGVIDLLGIIVGSAYVMALILLHEILHVPTGNLILTVFILVATLSIFLPQYLSVIVYGTIITFAMGVSEAEKRVRLASISDRYFPANQGLAYHIAGANWGSIVFSVLLAVVPLFVNELPAWPLLMFIFIQITFWLFIRDEQKVSRWVTLISLLLGYGLPITIILIRLFGLPQSLYLGTNLAETFVGFSVILALGLGYFAINGSPGPRNYITRGDVFKHNTYLIKENCYYLLFVALGLLVVVVWVVSIAFGDNNNNIVLLRKANETVIFATILMAITGFHLMLSQIRGGREDSIDPPSNTPKAGNGQNGMTQLKFAFITSRPLSSIVAGLVTFLILIRAALLPIWLSLFFSIPIVLITMIGFVANDIYDYRKDQVGNLNRPIAKGLLKRSSALFYSIILGIGATIILALLDNRPAQLILAATLVGVTIYSPLSRRLPVFKGCVTALLCMAPIIYGSVLAHVTISIYIYLSAVIFIVGREILLDVKDHNKDIQSGIRTIAAILGPRLSRFVAWCLMSLGVLYFCSQATNAYSLIFAYGALVSLVVAFLMDIRNSIPHGGVTILTLLLCILAMPFAI